MSVDVRKYGLPRLVCHSLRWQVLHEMSALCVVGACLLSACASTSHSASSVTLGPAELASLLQQANKAQEEARTLFQNGQYLDAVAPAEQAANIREQITGTDKEDLANALMTLGEIRSSLIQLPQAKALFERALEIRRALYGSSHAKVAESLTALGTMTYAAGDFLQAIQFLEQSLTIRERELGQTHPDMAVTLSHLAIAQRGLSRLGAARENAERAVAILQSAQPARQRDLAIAMNVLGNIMGRIGDFEKAHMLLGESLQLFETISGPGHPDVAGALIQLAMLEEKQANYPSALPLLKKALTINQRVYGTQNAEIAGNLHEIGKVERALGDHASAQRHFEQALQIQEATVGLSHPFVAFTLIELADIKHHHGDRTGARFFLQRALEIQEKALGNDHTSVAQTLTSLGYLEALAMNLSTAEKHFERAVRIRETALGAAHRDVAASLLDLARAKHAQGELSRARTLYDRARQILEDQGTLHAGLDEQALNRIWKTDMKGLQDYAELLATLARSSKDEGERLAAVTSGFTITQQARGWLMQAAVARALAQREVDTPSGLTLAKQVEDLRRRRQAIWTQLNALYALPESQRDASDLDRVKRALKQVQQLLELSNSRLRSTTPRYAEVSQPEALDIEAARRLLGAKEALISFYTLGDRTQIWLVRPDSPPIYREAAIGRQALLSLVQQVRMSLSPKHDVSERTIVPPFDVQSAAEVYDLLFRPISSALTSLERLILVPDEILMPLPFSTLLTGRDTEIFARLAEQYRRNEMPSPDDLSRYEGLPWLSQSYSLTIIPSVSALKLIREQKISQQGETEPFLGFGDPVLAGAGKQRGGKMLSSRASRVIAESLRTLNQLPGTRSELLAVAQVLGASPENALFLGPRATESEVRRLNESGRLGHAGILSFATHGLLAGEIMGLTQPALVLTPPDTPTDDDDGLLSLDDVLQLKLPHTDWVILSACNTAGDDGSGESLSGLARAFFFAGAKGLLVSQWSVDDQATQALMTEIFTRYGKGQVAPAEALRQGMLAIMNEGAHNPERAYFAHPFAWAAFFLVGEGRQ